MIDDTHDPARSSWVESANGHASFPIQNLPIGIVSIAGGTPRGAMAIGDAVIDLAALSASDLLTGDALTAGQAAAEPTLNRYLALDGGARRALRSRVSELLCDASAHRAKVKPMLVGADAVTHHLPTRIGDYTDFYAGIHHARNASRAMGGDGQVLPNYHHVPIAYHGRASSVRVSGTPVHWPSGQASDGVGAPTFGPSGALDYETEVALWICGDNRLGDAVAIGRARSRLAGIGMLNDWSARDVQRWEMFPLGPFLSKSFMTTVSPWIVTVEALAPFFRAQPPRATDEPAAPAHLLDDDDQANGSIELTVVTSLRSARMAEQGLAPYVVSEARFADLHWTPGQMIAHHGSNGCDLHAGDLLGTGTISAPPPAPGGCLLEITRNGRHRLTLPTGEERVYLAPGDEVILEGRCRADGFVTIGTGAARGTLSGKPA